MSGWDFLNELAKSPEGWKISFQLRTMSTVTARKGVFAPDGNTRAFRDQPVLDPYFPSDSANGAQTFFYWRNAQRNDYGNGCTLCSCRIELPGATLVGSYRGGLTPKVEPCCSEEWTICFRAIAA